MASGIMFGAVTDAEQQSGFPADSPQLEGIVPDSLIEGAREAQWITFRGRWLWRRRAAVEQARQKSQA